MKKHRLLTLPGFEGRDFARRVLDMARLEDATVPVGADCEAVPPDEIIAEYERLRAENPN